MATFMIYLYLIYLFHIDKKDHGSVHVLDT